MSPGVDSVSLVLQFLSLVKNNQFCTSLHLFVGVISISPTSIYIDVLCTCLLKATSLLIDILVNSYWVLIGLLLYSKKVLQKIVPFNDVILTCSFWFLPRMLCISTKPWKRHATNTAKNFIQSSRSGVMSISISRTEVICTLYF